MMRPYETVRPVVRTSILLGLLLCLSGCPEADIGAQEAREQAGALMQERRFAAASRQLAEAASAHTGHPQAEQLNWYRATIDWQAMLAGQDRPAAGRWVGGVDFWFQDCPEMDDYVSVDLTLSSEVAAIDAGGTYADIPLQVAGQRVFGSKQLVTERGLCGYLSFQAVSTGPEQAIELWLAYQNHRDTPDPHCPKLCSWSGLGVIPLSSGPGE